MVPRISRAVSRASAVLAFALVLLTGQVSVRAAASRPRVRNVIFLVADGMSVPAMALARWYQGGRPLAMDACARGFVRTYSANSLITDSAAAGSAYATGRKVESESISVAPAVATMPGAFSAPADEAHRPLPTILEAARLEGLATGIVVSGPFIDATPAAFASHVVNRYSDRDAAAEQMVHAGIDLVLGAGTDFLSPGPARRDRKDGEDLVKALTGLGYGYVTDRAGLARVSGRPRVWGLFAPEALDSEIERVPGGIPGLEELTREALRTLSKDKDGFFLLVESGEIDKFGHDNDPIGIISEVLAFDRAFAAALEFARADGRTAVVACADHPTGGLNIENYGSLEPMLAVLRRARVTSYTVRDKAADDPDLEALVAREYGLTDLTAKEMADVRESLAKDRLPTALGRLMAARAGLSFSTDNHTGEDVALFSYHPSGYGPTDLVGNGVVQNTDIHRYMLRVLGLDPSKAGAALHQPASLFERAGAKVAVDRSDEANPVVRVTRGRDVLELPVNKSLAFRNGRRTVLDGLVTLVDGRAWVPRSALELLE